MGVTELELGKVIEEAMKSKQGPQEITSLFRQMALIIDRQAIALGGVEFHKDSIEKAALCHQEVYETIRNLQGKYGERQA